jgi:hypothetical protein
MKLVRKIGIGLFVLALFSGHARQLLNLAAGAVESTALAEGGGGNGTDHSGATCN